MSDETRVVIARIMAAIALMGAVVGVTWLALLGRGEDLWRDWVIHNGLIAVGSAVIAWLVAPKQPRNGAIWVFAWAGLFTGLLCLTYAAGASLLNPASPGLSFLDVVPAEQPLAAGIFLMFANFLWVGVFFPLTLGFVLFPDGRPPSPRWRWLVVTLIAAFALLCAGLFWRANPSSTLTLSETQDTNGGFSTIGASIVTVCYLGVFVLVPLCVAALVVRFRRSTGIERQQFRWVVWAAAMAGAFIVGAVIFDEGAGRLDVALVLGAIAMVVLLASFGFAIGRYRLYDVDVVISRTFVYGSLAVFITGVYVAIVVGIGWLIHAGAEPRTALSLLATVVVAIAFQPLRRRLQRIANRIVYGRRATPYEVLSTFSQRVGAIDDDVLAQITRSLVEGTTARSASLWMRRGDELEEMAVWPAPTEYRPRVLAVAEMTGADHAATISHDGEPLGMITLSFDHGQPLLAADERLLMQVASGLGLVLRNLQLTVALRHEVEQLRESRSRIVGVQDETRRKLERDLHDGAQQRLVALKIKLGIGETMARRHGTADVESILTRLRAETDVVIDSIRDFARGIYPPLLESEGLAAAITAQARKLPLPVTVHASGVGRYPRNVESTIYFCVLEALQNVIKYAAASSAHVSIVDDGDLRFDVTDDGSGFDPGTTAPGAGLVNMADRLDALNGSIDVDSTPGRGTTVRGRLPVEVMASP